MYLSSSLHEIWIKDQNNIAVGYIDLCPIYYKSNKLSHSFSHIVSQDAFSESWLDVECVAAGDVVGADLRISAFYSVQFRHSISENDSCREIKHGV